MNDRQGAMVISLDFELLWGMIDLTDVNSYGENIIGARTAVIRILELFEKYDIHATWAIVGFLYFSNIKELKENLPSRTPGYTNQQYSSYSYIDNIRDDEEKYFFAPELIKKIKETPNQEIATHTHSHYYCLEDGQDKDDFELDLSCTEKIAQENGITLKSIVFPRNQMNMEYTEIMKKHNIRCFRGNEKSWCNKATNEQGTTLLMRAIRLADSYINLTGHQCYGYDEIKEGELNNIRSSRFFRPYNPKFAVLEKLRLHRIKKQMYYAAKNRKIYHMWWHPHNFGKYMDENLKNLEELLQYYCTLKNEFGFESMSMSEVCGE